MNIIPNFEQTKYRLTKDCVEINGKYFITVYPPKCEQSKAQSALLAQDAVREFNRLKREGKSFDEILREIEKDS